MTTLTVTATQSGAGSVNGMALTVKVLTGALPAASQNGATVQNNSSITTAQLSITPHATGSVVYGAAANGANSTSFTALANTTFFTNVSDAVNGAAYGTLRGTSVTTAATPVTLGASAPSVGAGTIALSLAEILAATTINEDPSSPASVSTTAAKTVTTASFTPPSASLLVATVSNDYNGTPTNTVTVTDSTGLAWNRLVGDNYTVTSVWIAQIPGILPAIVQQVAGGEVSSYGIGTTNITSTIGNSLVVFAGWNTPTSSVPFPALAVSDSAGNLWKQLDISVGSVSAGSTVTTRGAIWIAVNARPVGWVSVSATGVVNAVGWLIAEIGGLPQNAVLDFAVANSSVASSTSITGTGTAQGTGFALVTGSASVLAVTSGPAGWTALTRVTQGDSTNGISVMPYWNGAVAPGTNTLNFTFNTGSVFSVLYCQILSSASPPAQLSTQFPFTMVEAAFGADPGLVSSSTEFTYSSEGIFWTDISSRVIGDGATGRMTATRGKQYELSQAETGTLEITLDNHDGAFTPTNPGSPYYSNAINANMGFANGVTAPWGAVQGTIGSSTAFAFATGLNANAVWSMTFTPDGVHSGGEFSSEFVSVNQNYTYSFSFWIYSAAGWSSGINATIAFYNAAKALLGSTSGTVSAIPAGAWTQFTVTGAVPPAGTVYAVAQGIFQGVAPATVFYISEAALVIGSAVVQTGTVALLTPIRVTTWWNGRQYPVWMGYVEQWPQAWPEMPQWGFSKVIAVDAVGVLSSIAMNSALVSDILVDNPYAYLPCNEQYTSAIVGATPQFRFLFGSSPYYAPTDANGLNALNKATNNQITGVYSDGQASQPVNTGVAMNFFGDNSTGVGATSYNAPLSGHRGPCMIYTDPGIASITSSGNAFTVEFWFTWNGPINSGINLLSMYGVPSSFWYNGANTFNGNNLLIWIKPVSTANELVVTLNQTSSINGPTILPSTTPQHVVILFNTGVSPGFTIFVNGVDYGGTVTGAFALNTVAVGLGPATYSYDCNNSSNIATYTSNNYSAGHFAIYPYALSPSRVSSHYQVGAAGYSGVSAAFRFAQILTWAQAGLKRGGYYTLNATGTAEATQIGPAYSLSGSSAASGVNSVAQSEGGVFYVAADGTATYIERQFFYNQSSTAVFGDNATSATAPLNANPGFVNGVTGWVPVNGTLVSSGTAYAGNGSGLFTPSGSGGTATVYTSTFGVAPLNVLDGGAWVLSPVGYGSVQTVYTWLNASGGTVSSVSSSTFALPANSWFFAQLQGIAPPPATVSAKFGIREIGSPGTVNTLYIAYGSANLHSPEVPFLKETEYGFDNTYVYNEVNSTQQDGPNQVITADYRDLTSQGQYFRRSTLSFQQNVVSPYDVADITTWSVAQYKQPSVHLNQMKILASANPLVTFPVVLHTDIGQLVTVNRRPVGGAPIATPGIIERVQVEIGSRFWNVTYQISPYTPSNSVLCADTNGFNTPATTTLGW